ncbi:MAG: site-specific DNA-methyltransferase [Acidimicrobiaceae bacterium]|nr:site-specific DNA-methyltransferase [Acidimicrobiaceae bacterium]
MSTDLVIPDAVIPETLDEVERLSQAIVTWAETAPAEAIVERLDGALALERWLKKRKMAGPMQTAARHMERAIGRHLGRGVAGRPRKTLTTIRVSDDPKTDEVLKAQFRLLAEYWPHIVHRLPLTRAAALKIARRLKRGQMVDGLEPPEIYCCSCKELVKEVGPESVDVIVTDPPYPRQFLDSYVELAETASVVLRPGGLCWAMSGQIWLPDVLERLGQHLEYHWTVAYLTPGGQATQIWPRHVNQFWKPVLVFVKGEPNGERWFGDVARSAPNDTDADSHPDGWAQSETGIADLVNRASEPGWVVCDPFLGSGTTAVVAAQLGRRFVGCDIDADRVADAKQRVGQ